MEVDYVDNLLRGIVGVAFLGCHKGSARFAAYQFGFNYLPQHFGGTPPFPFPAALETDGIPVDVLFYQPVYRSARIPVDPADFPALSWGRPAPLNLKTRYLCPVSERAAYKEAVWLPHHLFLGTQND